MTNNLTGHEAEVPCPSCDGPSSGASNSPASRQTAPECKKGDKVVAPTKEVKALVVDPWEGVKGDAESAMLHICDRDGAPLCSVANAMALLPRSYSSLLGAVFTSAVSSRFTLNCVQAAGYTMAYRPLDEGTLVLVLLLPTAGTQASDGSGGAEEAAWLLDRVEEALAPLLEQAGRHDVRALRKQLRARAPALQEAIRRMERS